jgi:ferritin-like metal-binding protein YciE
MDELKDAYEKKLCKMVSVEDLIIEHLPTMISKSSNELLRTGLSDHLEETKIQRQRLGRILEIRGMPGEVEVDTAFKMMVETAGADIETCKDKDVRDAVIIAAAQAVEHLEIAKYGTLIEWAKQLGDAESEMLLKDTLAEEKAADKKLSAVAEGGLFTTGVNEKAAH